MFCALYESHNLKKGKGKRAFNYDMDFPPHLCESCLERFSKLSTMYDYMESIFAHDFNEYCYLNIEGYSPEADNSNNDRYV